MSDHVDKLANVSVKVTLIYQPTHCSKLKYITYFVVRCFFVIALSSSERDMNVTWIRIDRPY